jgi:O-antigen ligase
MAEIDLSARRGTGLGIVTAAICQWGLIALAAWSPLPFGSARPWAWGILAAGVGILLIVRAAGDFIAQEGSERPAGVIAPAALLFALAIFWAIFQCLPWAPAAWKHPIWDEAGRLLPGLALRPAISIDPESSRTAILHLVTYAAVFWLSFRSCQRAATAQLVVFSIGMIGALYAAWGLAVYWAGNHYVLWFTKWAYFGDLTSTFVNRNSYAAYSGLAVIALFGLFLEETVRRLASRESRRTRLRALVEGLLARRSIAIIVGSLMAATAVLLTHSRGGATGTGIGIVALFATASLAPSLRGPWRKWVALALLFGALAGVALSGGETITRVADTSWDLEGRHRIFELTLQAIANNPLIGTGLGTFKSIFPTYRTEDLRLLVSLAHNDYLENTMELGIPAAFMLFAAPLILVVRCFVGALQRHRDAIIPAIAVGASVLVGLQSLVDFSMQIPAVAVSYLVLLGAGVAQATPSRQRIARGGGSVPPAAASPPGR